MSISEAWSRRGCKEAPSLQKLTLTALGALCAAGLTLAGCSTNPASANADVPEFEPQSYPSAQSGGEVSDPLEGIQSGEQGPTERVAAPSSGDVTTEVETGELQMLPETSFDQNVEIQGVDIEILSIRRANVEARMAGEASGPGVVLQVRIENETGSPINLSSVTVAGETSDGSPLAPMSGTPSEPFFGSLQSGSAAEATYAFRIYSESDDGSIMITVNPSPDLPVAVFAGTIN